MKDHYIINPKLSWRFIEDEILILDSNGKQAAHDLNSIGSFIFEKIDQGLSSQEILETLISQYSEKEEQVRIDFNQFIKDLESQEIILQKTESND